MHWSDYTDIIRIKFKCLLPPDLSAMSDLYQFSLQATIDALAYQYTLITTQSLTFIAANSLL